MVYYKKKPFECLLHNLLNVYYNKPFEWFITTNLFNGLLRQPFLKAYYDKPFVSKSNLRFAVSSPSRKFIKSNQFCEIMSQLPHKIQMC